MTLAHFPGRDPFRMAAWQAPRAMRGWLTDDSSLTARIRARCGRFSLQVVGQGKAGVLPDELAALGVQRHGALWQREVLLLADGEPALPPLWARRSAFRRHGVPLLVTEIFLPAIRNLNP